MELELLEQLMNVKANAACKDSDMEWFFEPNLYPKAKKVCADCPVKTECLEYAMEAQEQYGIWGGTSPEMRRKLRQTRRRNESNPT